MTTVDVQQLIELAAKAEWISRLAMIANYLVDDPNYTRQEGALDILGVINDIQCHTPTGDEVVESDTPDDQIVEFQEGRVSA